MASGAKVVIENGATFDQLVDVLLSQPLSKNDTKFITIFLTLYRNFACPRQLLEGIVTRFQQASGCAGAAAASAAGGGAAGGGSTSATTSPLSDTICRLRYLAILEQWIKQYPGDFAYHLTYRRTKQFVADLSGDRICLVAVREITAHLAIVSEDDDTYWACNDQDWLTRQASLADDSDSASSGDIARAFDDMGISDGGAAAAAAAASQGGVAATGRSRNSVVTSPHSDASQTALGMAEERERELKLLSVDPKVHCTKTQWRQIMAQTADAIALELTRIDWVMFSAIRPRDLVRHVTLTAEQRKCCKGLGNVDRIIDHFNHLAYWVINLVLLRDKPKHRALILEKFMKVARVSQLGKAAAVEASLSPLTSNGMRKQH